MWIKETYEKFKEFNYPNYKFHEKKKKFNVDCIKSNKKNKKNYFK